MTPTEFEGKYGIDAKSLRAYLRSIWDHPIGTSWALTPEMVS